MAAWALLLHPPSPGPSSLAPAPQRGGTHRKGGPVISGISGEDRGRCWPSPPRVTLQGEQEGGVIRGLTWEMRQPR